LISTQVDEAHGAVYLYDLNYAADPSATKQKIQPNSYADRFGFSVTFHGNRLAVGAFLDGDTPERRADRGYPPLDPQYPPFGAAFVYRYDATRSIGASTSTNWINEEVLRVTDRNYFGLSVALSAGVLAVGNPTCPRSTYPLCPAEPGAAYVYACNPGAFWNHQTDACEPCGLGTYSAGGVGAQCGN
jgi:hypothetical protein